MKTTLRLGAGAVGLLLMLTGLARADHYVTRVPSPVIAVHTSADYYRPGELVTMSVAVDRPSWVMVVETDEQGFVRRLVESVRGVHVTPRRPLVLRFEALPGAGRGYAPVTRTVTVFSQTAPFRDVHMECGSFAPPGICVHCGFGGLCEMHFAAGFPGRSGLTPTLTAHTRYTVLAYRRPQYRSDDSWPAWVWGIPSGARIYIDGAFVGFGVDACLHLPAGQHRVTVLSREGVKETRVLTVSQPGVNRQQKSFARGDEDGLPGYRYKERR